MAQFATVVAHADHVDAMRTRLGRTPGGLETATTEEEALAVAREEFEPTAIDLDVEFLLEIISAYEIWSEGELIGWSVDC